MRILIIEDEVKTAAYLQKGLTESGFIVDVATNGEDGLHLSSVNHYDVMIADIMLPGIDGWQVIDKIRSTDKHTRVIFLTARDDVQDRVKGLELGADDYLTKPFAFSELLARVRALARRKQAPQANYLEAADLKIDVLQHKVVRSGKEINLTSKEFSLLVLLMQHENQILTRTIIAERVWDINFDCGTNVVDVAIRRLRRKIDDDFQPKLIHTMRGIGYVFKKSYTTFT